MIARPAYDDLPVGLREELAAAGLDPRAVHALVVAAVDEDLAGGPVADDVTSAATVPDGARGRAVIGRQNRPFRSPGKVEKRRQNQPM